jgi:putative Ca2+/H+ antiporter (TMEM165/GDT1 family)
LAFGILALICAVAWRRLVILASSVISLLWFLFFAVTYADWASYQLTCVVGVAGGILGMLGGLLLEKK